ncbi:MAG: guanylate kinase [Eubacterium sp.]|nr:guanylate kinase [Eubacterium sp.]
MARGKLLVISGFSGVGKGTTVKKMVEEYEKYKLSVSATTRNPRAGEVHGEHYYFVTKEQFEQMIVDKELLEYAEFVGNYYGTPKSYVEENLEKGNHVILEIECQGAEIVKKLVPEAVLVFILPPSAEELKNRLLGRNTEDPEVIEQRLLRAVEETEYLKNYEYFVINDLVENCMVNIDKIIENDHPLLPTKEQIETIVTDIKKFKKGE